MTEWELIELLKQKDESAFKTIVTTWKDMVYNTALGIVQNAEDAEDIAQDVFVRVYESVHTFKGDAKLSTWIYRITVTQSLDHLRRKKRKKRFAFIESLFGKNDELINDPPDFTHPGIVAEKKENAKKLFKAIAELPEKQNIAFVLNKVEGLSYQQISDIMEMTESAVDSLLHRAKMNLRKKLQKEYDQT